MSLGNWAIWTKAFGDNRSAFAEWTVEPYKNWLYVRRSGELMAEFQHGAARFGPVWIIARRGPRDGVYFCVWNWILGGNPGFLGLACYGYSDRGTWKGVTKSDLGHLLRVLARPPDGDTPLPQWAINWRADQP